MSQVIRVSAVVMLRPDGRVLTVRKSGTHRLMLPGGKPEPGENASDTAVREFLEELGVALNVAHLRLIGTYSAKAANEPGHELVASVFEHPYLATIDGAAPRAEIEQVEWVDLDTDRSDLAPLNTDVIFPILRARRDRHGSCETDARG